MTLDSGSRLGRYEILPERAVVVVAGRAALREQLSEGVAVKVDVIRSVAGGGDIGNVAGSE